MREVDYLKEELDKMTDDDKAKFCKELRERFPIPEDKINNFKTEVNFLTDVYKKDYYVDCRLAMYGAMSHKTLTLKDAEDILFLCLIEPETDIAHTIADNVLLKVIRGLTKDYERLIDTYDFIDKWYA